MQQSPDLEISEKRAVEHLSNRAWRLSNLYKIRDASGSCVQFKPNWAQRDFFANLHNFNVILKARQLGFSTCIMLYLLDSCLFNSNHAAGVIAQGLVEAQDLFENKIKFAYDNLPDWLKKNLSCTSDSARRLTFSNGSTTTVGTSLRGGTFQKLHISEMGKIAARFPDKAKEIKTGAFNTVHAGQQIFVESTAEGQQGEFFDLVQTARKLEAEGRELTELDPRFHFYPWYKNPNYELHDRRVSVTVKDAAYFESLGVELTPSQKAWYVKKASLMGDAMKREFPSTPDEAFEGSLEGTYYANEMMLVRKQGQITNVPWEPSRPVDTFWDLGVSDDMAIWFFQHIRGQYRFINYYRNSGEGLAHYAQKLRSLGYTYGTHYFPHDGNMSRLGADTRSAREIAMSLGIRPIEIVPRTKSVQDDIQLCRSVLPKCWFDEAHCSEGIVCLDSYRKEWDDKNGVWKNKPRHDEASHGADAFRTFVRGYKGGDATFGETPIVVELDYNMWVQ